MTVQIFEPLAHNWERPGRKERADGGNPAAGQRRIRFELRRGTFHVVLDGNDVASIEWKQAIEVPIELGRHTLQIRTGRYTSRRRSFDTADGEITNFRCNGRRIWPLYVATIVKPDLALRLKRE